MLLPNCSGSRGSHVPQLLRWSNRAYQNVRQKRCKAATQNKSSPSNTRISPISAIAVHKMGLLSMVLLSMPSSPWCSRHHQDATHSSSRRRPDEHANRPSDNDQHNDHGNDTSQDESGRYRHRRHSGSRGKQGSVGTRRGDGRANSGGEECQKVDDEGGVRHISHRASPPLVIVFAQKTTRQKQEETNLPDEHVYPLRR